VYSVRLTHEFEGWLDSLRDKKAQIRVVARLRQAEAGNLEASTPDSRAVGD